METNVKIISDGTAKGTAVEVDGVKMGGVTMIEVEPILANTWVKARVHLERVQLDVAVRDDDGSGLVKLLTVTSEEHNKLRDAAIEGVELLDYLYKNYSAAGRQQDAYKIKTRLNMLNEAIYSEQDH